jgi:hypothetical protein
MVTFEGVKNGKYRIREHDKGVLLNFTGEDADKFVQVRKPKKPTQVVEFSLTLKYLANMGMLRTDRRVWQAVELVDGGWGIVSLSTAKFDHVLKKTYNAMKTAAQSNDGYLPEEFMLPDLATEVEAVVAYSVATRVLDKWRVAKTQ